MRLLIWLLLNLNSKRRLPSELGVVEIFWESLFLESVSEFLNLEMLALVMLTGMETRAGLRVRG